MERKTKEEKRENVRAQKKRGINNESMKFAEEQESEKIEDIGADEIRAAKQQEKKEDIKAKETKGAFKKLSWFRSIKQKLAITLDKILDIKRIKRKAQ